MINYVTNQSMIGWKQAFRGHVVKYWRNDCKDRFFNHEINKIIIKMCTNHYVECWKDRNEEFHDPQKQRQYVIEWMKAIERMILNSNKECAIKCLRSQEVNVQETSTKHLQRRNRHLLEVHKKSKEGANNWDIRSFMVTKD